MGPGIQFSGACEQSHWWPARHTAGGHLLSVVQAATNTERLNPILANGQIKEDTVEPSVPAREFNLKAYTAITWHNDLASLGLESNPDSQITIARQRVPWRYQQCHQDRHEYLSKSNQNLVHCLSCQAVRCILISVLAVCLKALVLALNVQALSLRFWPWLHHCIRYSPRRLWRLRYLALSQIFSIPPGTFVLPNRRTCLQTCSV